MSVLAVIPARGGSVGVPRKNLQRVGGVPLVVRAVKAAFAAPLIDRVVVSTDDPEIAAVAKSAGAEIVIRPAEISGSKASSESALLHALETVGEDPRVVVLVQATSPFIDPVALDDAVGRVLAGQADVVFSAFPTYAFLWEEQPEGFVGVNHDSSFRPLRQDRAVHYQETGAFYALDVSGFREARSRFFGRVEVALTEEHWSMEIDTPEELHWSNAIASLTGSGEAIDVDAVVTDFDGVHTDDRVLAGVGGEELITANRSDGMGVRLLLEEGVPVLIISTEQHPVVTARARKIRAEIMQGVDDKATALRAWANSNGIGLERIAYVGNDVNDLGCLELVGWPIAVPDAHPSVRAAARVILQHRGGAGAVREVADRVLQSKR